MTVYLELIFLDNFLTDTLLLWLAARFVPPRSRGAILLAGCLGGLYGAAAALFPPLASPLGTCIGGIAPAIICFGRSVPKGLLYFCTFSLLLGGAVLALCLVFSETASKMLLLGCGLAAMLVTLLTRSGFAPQQSVTVEAKFGGQTIVFSAEYDSGCAVKDTHGNAVILVDRAFFLKNIRIDAAIPIKQFPVVTAAGEKTLFGYRPRRLFIQNRRADAWIVTGEHICLNGCPAVFGNGLKIRSEEKRCSKRSYKSCISCFFAIAAIMSARAKRCLRRLPKRRKRKF